MFATISKIIVLAWLLEKVFTRTVISNFIVIYKLSNYPVKLGGKLKLYITGPNFSTVGKQQDACITMPAHY